MFAQNFAGNHVDLLIGKEIKVLPINNKDYGYKGFYKDEKLLKTYKKKILYSDYDSLIDKVFIVKQAIPYVNEINDKCFKLVLDNKELGVIYYDYNPIFETDFNFEVIGGLKLPDDFYCENITKEIDKFTGEIKYRADYNGLSIVKTITFNFISMQR